MATPEDKLGQEPGQPAQVEPEQEPESVPDDIVPAAFVAERPKRREELKGKPPPAYLQTLKYRHVEVRAQGLVYTGKLEGSDEQELYLRGASRYVVLPLETVTSVRPLDNPPVDEDEPTPVLRPHRRRRTG